MQGMQYHLHNIQEQKAVNSNGQVRYGMQLYVPVVLNTLTRKREMGVRYMFELNHPNVAQ